VKGMTPENLLRHVTSRPPMRRPAVRGWSLGRVGGLSSVYGSKDQVGREYGFARSPAGHRGASRGGERAPAAEGACRP